MTAKRHITYFYYFCKMISSWIMGTWDNLGTWESLEIYTEQCAQLKSFFFFCCVRYGENKSYNCITSLILCRNWKCHITHPGCIQMLWWAIQNQVIVLHLFYTNEKCKSGPKSQVKIFKQFLLCSPGLQCLLWTSLELKVIFLKLDTLSSYTHSCHFFVAINQFRLQKCAQPQ